MIEKYLINTFITYIIPFLDIPLDNIQIKSNTSAYISDAIVGIECEAHSRPLSTLIWTINNKTIVQAKNNIKILTINTNSDSNAKSILVINKLSSANNGEYRCIANDTVSNKVLTSPPLTIRKFTDFDIFNVP